MSDRSVRTIAIVGAGFSGTATAVHLLRQARERGQSIRVVLLERGAEFGRGLAYGKSRYPYLLNVPASRMSATTTDPEDFLRFARRSNPQISGEDFLPRSLYGDYLQDLLGGAAADLPRGLTLECLRAEVIDIDPTPGDRAAPITLRLADEGSVYADAVVVALGAPLARLPAAIRCTAGWPVLREDPWTDSSPLENRSPLLIVGTGLTMVDVVCAAADRDSGIEIHALSRHGLLPLGQSEFRPHALADDRGVLARSAASASRLLAAVRRLAEEAARDGADWREVVTLVRHEAPALWRRLTVEERGRFIRHARVYWDIHRHRVPAAVLARLDALRASRRLHLHAGRLLCIEAGHGGVRATWLVRGSGQRQTLDAAEVVNCTGPDYDVSRSSERLWQALLARGLAVPDALRLGIRTAPVGSLLARDGSESRSLFYIGPMLRADFWEATAVGELRAHAERLAAALLERLSRWSVE
jgi:uncharacterized NAD(P)/FAD-binding protein YdhS